MSVSSESVIYSFQSNSFKRNDHNEEAVQYRAAAADDDEEGNGIIDWLLESLFSFFDKLFYDFGKGIEDFISREWLRFEVSLTTLFASQEDLMRSLIVEAKLNITKLNEIYYTLTSDSVNGFMYYFKAIRTSLLVQESALTKLYDFLSGDTVTGQFYYIKQIRSSITNMSSVLDNLYKFLSGDTVIGQFYYIKQIRSSITDMSSVLDNLYKFLSGDTVIGQFYYIKQIRSDISNILAKMGGVSGGDSSEILEKMNEILKAIKNIDIDFGNIFQDITNEAGTNFWDVLGKMTDGIFNLSGEIVKATVDIIDSIANLIVDISEMLIDLLVPDDVDFIDNAFKGLSDDFKLKFDFVFEGIDSFTSVFKAEQKGFEDIEMNIGFLGSGTVKLPFSTINPMAAVVKPIVTAFLLLSFIIDQYKWFHTRGEITE